MFLHHTLIENDIQVIQQVEDRNHEQSTSPPQWWQQHCKNGLVILTIIVFLTRIATGLWDDTRIVPCDSQLWAIQCTWSSYRNNWICYNGWEFT